jgi:methyltransferase NSUN6
LTTIRVNNPEDMEKSKNEMIEKLKGKYEVFIHDVIPDCLCIPVHGPNEKIDLLESFVVVGQKCGEAVLRGANCFAPGVIGMSKAEKRVSILSQINDKKVTRGKKFQIEDIDQDYLFIGNGNLKMDHSSIFHTIKTGVAVETTECIYDTCSLDEVNSEHYFVQNLPSMMVAHILDPQPNEKVLDMYFFFLSLKFKVCCSRRQNESHLSPDEEQRRSDCI